MIVKLLGDSVHCFSLFKFHFTTDEKGNTYTVPQCQNLMNGSKKDAKVDSHKS